MKAALKPFAVGDGWQDVKVIGRNLRGDLPDVPIPGKPSTRDGDGDGFIDLNGDGIDKEPAPKVVEEAVDAGLDAASPAKKKKPKRSGPTPAQLAAQERNRAAAAEQQAEREAQQAQQLQEAADKEQERAKKIAADAPNVAKAEAMVEEVFKPLESSDISDSITLETAKASVRVNSLRGGNMLPEFEVRRTSEGMVKRSREMFGDFSGNRPRISPEGQQQTMEMVVKAVSESPLLRELVERHGLPAIVIFDSVSPQNMRMLGHSGHVESAPGVGDVKPPVQQSMEVADEMKHMLGYHQYSTGIVAINGRAVDNPERTGDMLPDLDAPEVWGVSEDGPGTVRHELGHWLHAISLESEDSVAAAKEIEEYYDRVVAPAAEPRQTLSAPYNPDIQQALRRGKLTQNDVRRMLESANRQRSLMEPTSWLSPYGHTDSAEFFAESFAMLSSPDPDIRAAVPEEVKGLIARVLDIDPSKL